MTSIDVATIAKLHPPPTPHTPTQRETPSVTQYKKGEGMSHTTVFDVKCSGDTPMDGKGKPYSAQKEPMALLTNPHQEELLLPGTTITFYPCGLSLGIPAIFSSLGDTAIKAHYK